MSDINILAVLVAAVSSFLLGGLWYSPRPVPQAVESRSGAWRESREDETSGTRVRRRVRVRVDRRVGVRVVARPGSAAERLAAQGPRRAARASSARASASTTSSRTAAS